MVRRAPLTSPQVFIAGVPLSARLIWGDLRVVDRWPYGPWECEWGIVKKPYQRLPALRTDAAVEVRIGSGVRWAGRLAEPDWDEGKMTAFGLVRQAEETLALDALGNLTSIPNTAIDQAITRGAIDWVRRQSISSSAITDGGTTAEPNYLIALLDAWANTHSSGTMRWALTSKGEVYAAQDPTTPSLWVRPGVAELGLTNRAQVGTIFGRYQTTLGGWATVSVGSGRPEVGVSLKPHGPLSATDATRIITSIRNKAQAKPSFTSGLVLSEDDVMTAGGQRIGMDRVVAGKMARLLGLRDDRANGPNTDIVLADSEWLVTPNTVEVSPIGTEDDSLGGIIDEAGGELLS